MSRLNKDVYNGNDRETGMISETKAELNNFHKSVTKVQEDITTLEKNLNKELTLHKETIDDQNNRINTMYSSFIAIIVSFISVGFVFITIYSYIMTFWVKLIELFEDKKIGMMELLIYPIVVLVIIVLLTWLIIHKMYVYTNQYIMISKKNT